MVSAMFMIFNGGVFYALLDLVIQVLDKVILPVVLRESVVDRLEDGRVVVVKRFRVAMCDRRAQIVSLGATAVRLLVEAKLVVVVPAAG